MVATINRENSAEIVKDPAMRFVDSLRRALEKDELVCSLSSDHAKPIEPDPIGILVRSLSQIAQGSDRDFALAVNAARDVFATPPAHPPFPEPMYKGSASAYLTTLTGRAYPAQEAKNRAFQNMRAKYFLGMRAVRGFGR